MKVIRNCLLIIFSSAVLAFALSNIHSAANVTEGGVLGLTLFFYKMLGISPAISSFLLNAFCYILGFKTLGKRFLGYSAVSALFFSLFYKLFEYIGPLFISIANRPLLAAVLGAVLVGVSVGVCVKIGGAPTGDDALAMSLSSLLNIKIEWIYLISDITVLALSLFYIPLSKIAYSLLTVIISGKVIGFIQNPKKFLKFKQ